MPILPLPQFESDVADLRRAARVDALVEAGFSRDEVEGLDDADLLTFERKKPPKTLVVRFGRMKMVGEYPYAGTVTPGCGSKVVVRTHRGTELAETLTSTCPNAGCSKSVSRQEMLTYIENSGGRDYPFFDQGRVLRIATGEDLDTQSRLEQASNELRARAREAAAGLGLAIKIVDVEPILGGERITYFFTSEERVDLGGLAAVLGRGTRARIDLRHVGARDEARLVADYEKCGQYCCCKNFLKVLKPVSMKSAKVQKATLDPLKISGRCGRLMCCLRYEDQTYDELRKRLPKTKRRVGTPDGDGTVVEVQILTQLVLVEFEDGQRVAFPVEEIGAAGERPESTGAERPERAAAPRGRPLRGRPGASGAGSGGAGSGSSGVTPVGDREIRRGERAQRPGSGGPRDDAARDVPREAGRGVSDAGGPNRSESATEPDGGEAGTRKKRRRRRRRTREDGEGGTGPAPADRDAGAGAEAAGAMRAEDGGGEVPEAEPANADRGDADAAGPETGPETGPANGPARRRRRRRRRSGGSGDAASGPGDAGGDGGA